jgi:hypothetical protein
MASTAVDYFAIATDPDGVATCCHHWSENLYGVRSRLLQSRLLFRVDRTFLRFVLLERDDIILVAFGGERSTEHSVLRLDGALLYLADSTSGH